MASMNEKTERSLFERKHDWVTVVNPMNQQLSVARHHSIKR